jgi:Na+-transporting NADH:ubiquinone oxidoreductase subunit NqrC
MLVGYLTSYFSKNMIVILVISLVVSNVVKSGTNIVLEGMQEGSDKVPDESQEGVINTVTDEAQEGADEAYEGDGSQDSMVTTEGTDESAPKEMTCKADKDCEPGYLCNDKYVCAK